MKVILLTQRWILTHNWGKGLAVAKALKTSFYVSCLIPLIWKLINPFILFQLLEDWMVGGKNAGYCGPNVQEKSVLLVKMMQCIEKRFPDLNCQFLDIIYNIYKYVFTVAYFFIRNDFILSLAWPTRLCPVTSSLGALLHLALSRLILLNLLDFPSFVFILETCRKNTTVQLCW